MKRITPWFLTLPILASFWSGCTYLSTGARTAYVVVERPGVAARVSPLASPVVQDQAKSQLDARHLWVTDDVRSAKWLAVFDDSNEAEPTKSATLTLKRLERNPSWDPLAVSSPWPIRGAQGHPSLSLAEANEQIRQYGAGR